MAAVVAAAVRQGWFSNSSPTPTPTARAPVTAATSTSSRSPTSATGTCSKTKTAAGASKTGTSSRFKRGITKHSPAALLETVPVTPTRIRRPCISISTNNGVNSNGSGAVTMSSHQHAHTSGVGGGASIPNSDSLLTEDAATAKAELLSDTDGSGGSTLEHSVIPSEKELVLLSLDHLRDLRRSASPGLLRREGLDPDYLAMACWALSRAVSVPDDSNDAGYSNSNDCWSDKPILTATKADRLPSLAVMTEEVLDGCDELDYDDLHSSNAHRLYPLAGLASTVPLVMGQLVAAGMVGLAARTRRVAQAEMVKSPLFDNFVQAVTDKGFFDNADATVYRQRHNKVVAKFRTKLAAKADAETKSGDLMAHAAAGQYMALREQSRVQPASDQTQDEEHLRGVPSPQHTVNLNHQNKSHNMFSSNNNNNPAASSTLVQPQQQPQPPQTHPADLEEAERLKALGNTHMQKKEYQQAAESYTAALKLTPSGPQSHIYYSNRAAALVSMREFHQAIQDSERALALCPEYGKAHARLGLAHFLLGNYRPALEAYTVALKYEPENASSKNYLEKAAQRLAEEERQFGQSGVPAPKTPTSYSVVSQWDQRSHHQQHHNDQQQQQQHVPPPSPTSNHYRPTTPQHYQQQPTPQQPTTPSRASQHSGIGSVGTTTNNNNSSNHSRGSSAKYSTSTNPALREAEKYKTKGNQLMAGRQYVQALDAYSKAIEILPDGPQSHVYFSNRAAALCYLEHYKDAQNDSLQSLVLNPTYGKAHARLGLSRFFLHDYQGAVEAYEASLRYDPENAASKSYLLKAQTKLLESLATITTGGSRNTTSTTGTR